MFSLVHDDENSDKMDRVDAADYDGLVNLATIRIYMSHNVGIKV
jgi:hypothetical protein